MTIMIKMTWTLVVTWTLRIALNLSCCCFFFFFLGYILKLEALEFLERSVMQCERGFNSGMEVLARAVRMVLLLSR